MKVAVNAGPSTGLELFYALLVYQATDGISGEKSAYVTLHDAETRGSGAPRLGAGRPADLGFLRALSDGLQQGVKPEILPEHVLCRTADVVVWWSCAQRRPLFFSEYADEGLSRLNAKSYAMPALVWKIEGRHLFVRALREDRRPVAATKLFHAPYWNTDASGKVCLGDMKRPASVEIATLQDWEHGYFGSQFTGQNGAGARVKGGLTKFWKARSQRASFPSTSLVDSGETLERFVCSSREND